MNHSVHRVRYSNRKLASAVVMAIVMLLNIGDSAFAKKGDPVKGVEIGVIKRPNGTEAKLGSGGVPKPPEGFFGPGSLPFEGTLNMDPNGPVVIRRNTPGVFGDATTAVVETELLQLSLTSITPIEPLLGSFFDVQIDMHSASPGFFKLQNDEEGAFLIDSFFDVFVDLQFTPVGGGETRSLQGTMPLEFNAPIPWDNALPNVPPLFGGFVLGTDGTMLVPYILQSPDGEFSVTMTSAPEPSTLALAALGLAAGLLGRRRVGKGRRSL